ncbi:MAG: hypothetical protein U9N86_10340 [Bacteroidota bacterium]|nr:hypothetical protein [Bacteroidota bacterium]
MEAKKKLRQRELKRMKRKKAKSEGLEKTHPIDFNKAKRENKSLQEYGVNDPVQ